MWVKWLFFFNCFLYKSFWEFSKTIWDEPWSFWKEENAKGFFKKKIQKTQNQNNPCVVYMKMLKYMEPVFSIIYNVIGQLSHGSASLLSHLKQE